MTLSDAYQSRLDAQVSRVFNDEMKKSKKEMKKGTDVKYWKDEYERAIYRCIKYYNMRKPMYERKGNSKMVERMGDVCITLFMKVQMVM